MMHQQFNIQQLYVLPTQYLCVFYLSQNKRDLCHLQHKLIGFYNRDGKFLLLGMNCAFRYSTLRFIFKRLMQIWHTESVSFLHFYAWFCFITTITNMQEIYKKIWRYERFILQAFCCMK